MDARYDLFELSPGGFPEWIGSAVDFPEAKVIMDGLPQPPPGGQYLIRDFYSGTIVAYTHSSKPCQKFSSQSVLA